MYINLILSVSASADNPHIAWRRSVVGMVAGPTVNATIPSFCGCESATALYPR